jgi:acid-sensing ion channel, other
VGLAIFSIVYISLELSVKFSSSPLSTVVESTIYPVSEIAYPAITICPNNRLNAQRCTEAEQVFLPNASDSTLKVFRLLLAGMNNLEFGALDEFYSEIFDYTSDELNQLNLTELFEYTMLSCEHIFTGTCWWRNKYYNCCDDFFVLQKSEYGICYSFNSAVNEIGLIKEVN